MNGTYDVLGALRTRACPLCGSTDDHALFADQRLDASTGDPYTFASRKRPQRTHLRLVCCPGCDLVYASPVPPPEALARAYGEAAFDTAVEARFAAATYSQALRPLLDTLPDRDGALDIGTGEGAFLAQLLDAGFTSVSGVEPSLEPIAAAAARVAGLIEHNVFRSGARPPATLSLVTCFQTIEHVPDPAVLVRDAVRLLKPGGMLALVCHDRRAPINRLLGMRSPIVDVEHQQLFSAASVTRLLADAGLVDVGRRAIRNRYPVRYWVRLLPLPARAGKIADRRLARTRIGDRAMTIPVGNLLAWGRRPTPSETRGGG